MKMLKQRHISELPRTTHLMIGRAGVWIQVCPYPLPIVFKYKASLYCLQEYKCLKSGHLYLGMKIDAKRKNNKWALLYAVNNISHWAMKQDTGLSTVLLSKWKCRDILHFMQPFCSRTVVYNIYANVIAFRIKSGIHFLDKLWNSTLEGKLFL